VQRWFPDVGNESVEAMRNEMRASMAAVDLECRIRKGAMANLDKKNEQLMMPAHFGFLPLWQH